MQHLEAAQKTDSLVKDRSNNEFSTFDQFYLRFYRDVYNLAFRLGVTNDLEDVVQRTFIKVWLNLDKFQRKSNLKSWLTRITINTAYDSLRRSSPRKLPEQLEFAAHPQRNVEDRELVMKALSLLSFKHRTVIVLVLMEELSLQETSITLRIPLGTVKSRLTRAKKAMKEAIDRLGVVHDRKK